MMNWLNGINERETAKTAIDEEEGGGEEEKSAQRNINLN